MRLSLPMVLVLVVVTSGLSSAITGWVIQKRMAQVAAIESALQVEAAQRAETDAKQRMRNHIWSNYLDMMSTWRALSDRATLDEVVHALRENAQTMYRLDLTDYPPELTIAFQHAAQALVGYSNYWARIPLRLEDFATRSIAIPTASSFTGGVMLPIPDLDAVNALGGSTRAREEDAEATRQFTDAFVRLGKTMRRLGVLICGTG